jgi:hypothetical protein
MTKFAVSVAALVFVATGASAFAGTQWSATRVIEARQVAAERERAPHALTGEAAAIVRPQRDRDEVRYSPSYSRALFNFSRASR